MFGIVLIWTRVSATTTVYVGLIFFCVNLAPDYLIGALTPVLYDGGTFPAFIFCEVLLRTWVSLATTGPISLIFSLRARVFWIFHLLSSMRILWTYSFVFSMMWNKDISKFGCVQVTDYCIFYCLKQNETVIKAFSKSFFSNGFVVHWIAIAC